MELEVLQENLVAKLNHLHKIIPSNPQLPILSAILISTEKNSMFLAATDLYIGMKAEVPVKTIAAGSIAVPGKLFREAVASLDHGKITLKLDQQSLIISSENNTTTLQCLPVEEFPEFPEVKGEEIVLPAEQLLQIDGKVGFSTSLDQTRPVLTGLLFEFNDKTLRVVGTDGFRLAILEIPQEKNGLNQVLLPAKALSHIKQLISQEKDLEKVSIIVSQEQKQATIQIGSTALFIRVIEGDYPPYSKIVPESFTTEIKLDKEQLTRLLKRAQIFAREASNIVRLEIGESDLKVKASSSASGNQEGSMSIARLKMGDDSTIAFNVQYILDFLNTTSGDEIVLSMNQSLTPAQLSTTEDKNYRYIVMPFRVNE